jgi:hypothetical protein
MNDLVPLKVLARNELEASVLRSADADRAPEEAMQRVATRLGVSASLVALSSNAGAASMTGIGALGIMKSLLVGLGAGAFVSGALFAVSVVTQPARSPSVANGPPEGNETQHPVAEPRTTLTAASAVAAPTTAHVPAPIRANVSRLARRAPEPPAAAKVTPDKSASLAEEVAELDRARALLATGNASDALRVLDAYALRWPAGVMVPEAVVVRVEAELARGNHSRAESHARALINAHPNTGHARKVANLLVRAKGE